MGACCSNGSDDINEMIDGTAPGKTSRPEQFSAASIDEQNKAATKIQAHFRGKKTRAEIQREKENDDRLMDSLKQDLGDGFEDFPLDKIREARSTLRQTRLNIKGFNYGDGQTLDYESKDVKIIPDKDAKTTYQGETNAKGEREGKGEMTWADGDFYEGYWKANEPNGKGRLIYKNGETYEGDFENGHK